MRRSQIAQYIGSRLAEERQKLDIPQQDFAILIGCSQPQYGRYENGRRDISAVDLQMLASRLEIPVKSFYPPELSRGLDDSEAELIKAWRSKDLRRLLQLVGDRHAV